MLFDIVDKCVGDLGYMYHTGFTRRKLNKCAKTGYSGNLALVNVSNGEIHLQRCAP